MTTTIGYGSPNKANTAGVHGAALGADEAELTRKALDWSYGAFEVPQDAYDHWRQAISRQPEPRRRPFFALIARSGAADNGWLLARGRGGGLALWVLDPELEKASDA